MIKIFSNKCLVFYNCNSPRKLIKNITKYCTPALQNGLAAAAKLPAKKRKPDAGSVSSGGGQTRSPSEPTARTRPKPHRSGQWSAVDLFLGTALQRAGPRECTLGGNVSCYR